MEIYKIRLTKLKESDNPRHPENILAGTVVEREIGKHYFVIPEVGNTFNIGEFYRTSTVQEVLSKDTFRTYNSIYKWEILNE